MKIAFITAMETEFNALRSIVDFQKKDDFLQATIGLNTVSLYQCGMGKVNAAMVAERVCLGGAEMVVSLGIAGGLDSQLKQCDCVVSNRVCYHDVWCGEPNLMGQVQDLPLYFDTPAGNDFKTDDSSVKKGLIVTGDQFVTEIPRLKEIKQQFPDALAVDMESAAIAQVCYLHKIPFVSFRMISDVVGAHYQEEMYHQFWDTCPGALANQVKKFVQNLVL